MELPPWEEYKDLPWPVFMFVTVHVILQNIVVLLLVLPAREILSVHWSPHPLSTTALTLGPFLP